MTSPDRLDNIKWEFSTSYPIIMNHLQKEKEELLAPKDLLARLDPLVLRVFLGLPALVVLLVHRALVLVSQQMEIMIWYIKILINLARGTASNDPVRVSQLETRLPLSGGSMTGNLEMDGNRIYNVAQPNGDNLSLLAHFLTTGKRLR